MVTYVNGTRRFVRFPVVIVPGLGKHCFSHCQALSKGVSAVCTTNSHRDVNGCSIPIKIDDARTLRIVSLKTVPKPNTSHDTAVALTNIPETVMGLDTAYAAGAIYLDQSEGPLIDSTVVEADVWRKGPGHLLNELCEVYTNRRIRGKHRGHTHPM